MNTRKELFKKIELGIRRGAAMALCEHKKMGRSIVVWDAQEHCVVTIPAKKIRIPDAFIKKTKP